MSQQHRIKLEQLAGPVQWEDEAPYPRYWLAAVAAVAVPVTVGDPAVTPVLPRVDKRQTGMLQKWQEGRQDDGEMMMERLYVVPACFQPTLMVQGDEETA